MEWNKKASGEFISAILTILPKSSPIEPFLLRSGQKREQVFRLLSSGIIL